MASEHQTVVTGPTTVRPANIEALRERRRLAERGKHPAQFYCGLAGLSLLLAGILGFIVDSSFDIGNNIDGGKLLGLFEVNGVHNVVHILSGLMLIPAVPFAMGARGAAGTFGLVYGVVTIIGLVDGRDVLTLLPVNAADNVLHIALSLLGIACALAPFPKKRSSTGAGTGVARPAAA